MKLKILDSLHNPDLISNAFEFLKNKRKLQLIKYSKKYQNKLNISKNDYKSYFNSIKLKSSENEKFIIDKKAAKRSGLLKECMEADENFKKMNLIEIDSKILKLIIEFLEHYKDSEPQLPQSPLQDSNVMQYLDEWSKIFFSKLNLEDIISLINASNYMDIKSLIKICSAIIASSMIDLPIEEVEKIFGIESDLTEEEMKEFDLYPIE
jgi:hypothetical protein